MIEASVNFEIKIARNACNDHSSWLLVTYANVLGVSRVCIQLEFELKLELLGIEDVGKIKQLFNSIQTKISKYVLNRYVSECKSWHLDAKLLQLVREYLSFL